MEKRQAPNQATEGTVDQTKLIQAFQEGGGDIEAHRIETLVGLAEAGSGLTESEVDDRITAAIPANRRLPDPTDVEDGHVATVEDDALVYSAPTGTASTYKGDYDATATYVLGDYVGTGPDTAKEFWTAVNASLANANSPDFTTLSAVSGWRSITTLSDYRGNAPVATTHYHVGNRVRVNPNIYLCLAAGTYGSATIPTSGSFKNLTEGGVAGISESDADAKYVETAGDTMTGKLTVETPAEGTQKALELTRDGEDHPYISLRGKVGADSKPALAFGTGSQETLDTVIYRDGAAQLSTTATFTLGELNIATEGLASTKVNLFLGSMADRHFTVSDTAPTEPAPRANDLWLDTTDGNNLLKAFLSSAWVTIGSGSGTVITVSDTEPSSPTSDQIWIDTANNLLKVYDTSTSAFVSIGGGGTTVVVNPSDDATGADITKLSIDGTIHDVAGGGTAGSFDTASVGSASVDITTANLFVATGIIAPTAEDSAWLLINLGSIGAAVSDAARWVLVKTAGLLAKNSTVGVAANSANALVIRAGLTSSFTVITFHIATIATTREILLVSSDTSLDALPFSVEKVVAGAGTAVAANPTGAATGDAITKLQVGDTIHPLGGGTTVVVNPDGSADGDAITKLQVGSTIHDVSGSGGSSPTKTYAHALAATQPTAPSPGDFTAASGTISAYPTGWSENFPTGAGIIWVVNLSVSGSTVTVGTVRRLTGDTGAAGENTGGSWSSETPATLPSSWTEYRWYATGYTPVSTADYLDLIGESGNIAYPNARIKLDRFRALTANSDGDTVHSVDNPIPIPVAKLHSHYTLFIGRTSDNEVLVAASDANAGYSDLDFRTYREGISSSQQQAVASGNDRWNLILFRRSASEPSAPTNLFTGEGYSPAITDSTDWRTADPDSSSTNSLWMAYAQSTYDSDNDTFSQTAWTVVPSSDGFALQYSHGSDPDDLDWHPPPLHGADHATPDPWMRFRNPVTNLFSAPIRIIAETDRFAWTPIVTNRYAIRTYTQSTVIRTFEQAQLAQFGELLFRVRIFNGFSNNVPSPVYGTVEKIVSRELSGGSWALAPSSVTDGVFNAFYTYRCRANRYDGLSVVFGNDEPHTDDSYAAQRSFFLQIRRLGTSIAGADATMAGALIFFGMPHTYNRFHFSLYGR